MKIILYSSFLLIITVVANSLYAQVLYDDGPIINSIPGGRQAWVAEGRKWQAACLK